MIKSIQLKNWRTHKDSEFDFGKGTNVLIGRLGSGKSSVMNAICFALFGTFPALQRREVSIDEVIMQRPHEMDSAEIKLSFEYEGQSYDVERLILKGGKTNQGKLYRNGKLIAGPKVTEVNERIEQVLELNYDLFSRAVYSEQNQIDYFLRLSPGQRKEKFDELLDLQKYGKARANAVTLKNRLNTLTEDKKSILHRQRQEFDEEELKKAGKKLEESKKELALIQERLKEEGKKVLALEKEVREEDEKQKKFDLLDEKKD